MKIKTPLIITGGMIAALLAGQCVIADEREDYRKQMESRHQQEMQAEKERSEAWKRERDAEFEARKKEAEAEHEAIKQQHESDREAMKQQHEAMKKQHKAEQEAMQAQHKAEQAAHQTEMEARKAEAEARHEEMKKAYGSEAHEPGMKKEKGGKD